MERIAAGSLPWATARPLRVSDGAAEIPSEAGIRNLSLPSFLARGEAGGRLHTLHERMAAKFEAARSNARLLKAEEDAADLRAFAAAHAEGSQEAPG